MTTVRSLWIGYALTYIHRQRFAILAQPYTTEASRRLEELDEQAASIQALLDSEAPRPYRGETKPCATTAK